MLETGMTHSLKMTVEPHMTARNMKSGALDVFSTPWMIAFMENCCFDCAAKELEAGQGTVGTMLNIRHLAPTPVGMSVQFECTLTAVDRRKLVFDVMARDEREVIGTGTHERFIVDSAAFVAKCAAKTDKQL